MSESDENRRRAVEQLRKDVGEHVQGRVSSEQIHREMGEIARKQDRQVDEQRRRKG
jgi:hypothetical protein